MPRRRLGVVAHVSALTACVLPSVGEESATSQRTQACGVLESAPGTISQQCLRLFGSPGPSAGWGELELRVYGHVGRLGFNQDVGSPSGPEVMRATARLSRDPLSLEIHGLAVQPIRSGPIQLSRGRYRTTLVFDFDYGFWHERNEKVNADNNVQRTTVELSFDPPDLGNVTRFRAVVESLKATINVTHPIVSTAKVELSGEMILLRSPGSAAWCDCGMELATETCCFGGPALSEIRATLQTSGCGVPETLSAPLSCGSAPRQTACAESSGGPWAGIGCVDPETDDEPRTDEEPRTDVPSGYDECGRAGWCDCVDFDGRPYQDCCGNCPAAAPVDDACGGAGSCWCVDGEGVWYEDCCGPWCETTEPPVTDECAYEGGWCPDCGDCCDYC